MTDSTDAPVSGAAPEGGQDLLAAFRASNDQLLDKVYYYVRSRVPQHDVDDVFQEIDVALSVWVLTRRQQPEVSTIMAVARNKVVDFWREQEKRKPGVLTEPTDLQLLSSEMVDSSEDLTCRVDVERALAPLDDEERRALLLTHGYNFTQEEAAAMMGVPRGQVRRRVTSAINKIVANAHLAGYGEDPNPESDTRRTTQTGTPEGRA